MKIYLAHPFNSEDKMRKWSLAFEKKSNIKFVNPFYDEYKQEIEKWNKGEVSENKTYIKLDGKEIIKRDVELIARCDGILMIVDGEPSYGTIQEQVYAYFLRKEIYVVCTNGHHNHPWLKGHCTKMFTSLNDFEEWAKCL